ncbi:PREDICTED: uncharacterized protein LOC108565134 [Nicrophorus vespilloides]|uniref:Uncharacterized protein LOC108565134 n=1 Tax=Nicrophorus vespilloides TaxID=110193 RepID=A0ABM1MZA9_NICVS|nr:PREDICTED: uncharacterized protein LOC108565134 [Nicrophorus vespilloides]
MFSKLSYISILNQSLVTDPNNFNLCGGLLAIPCFWIAFTTHDNRKNYLLLPLLIVLLSISMTLLAVGSSITIIQRTKMSFSNCTDPPTLLPSHYKSLLIDTLKAGMNEYESNYNYKISWDRVQIRLQCCGVSGYRDWKSPPKSCYHNQTTHNGMFERGCLDGIAFEMSWHMCFLSGCALIALGIQMTTLVFVFYLYLKEKLGRATDVTSF